MRFESPKDPTFGNGYGPSYDPKCKRGRGTNTQPDYDWAKTLFDSYIIVRSRSDRLNVNAMTDDRVTWKWFFLLPY
jgi:hypothetical protein